MGQSGSYFGSKWVVVFMDPDGQSFSSAGHSLLAHCGELLPDRQPRSHPVEHNQPPPPCRRRSTTPFSHDKKNTPEYLESMWDRFFSRKRIRPCMRKIIPRFGASHGVVLNWVHHYRIYIRSIYVDIYLVYICVPGKYNIYDIYYIYYV